MKKSATILIAMLFSIAVPTLAESIDYVPHDTQPAVHVSHRNDDSASRHYSSVHENRVVNPALTLAE